MGKLTFTVVESEAFDTFRVYIIRLLNFETGWKHVFFYVCLAEGRVRTFPFHTLVEWIG